MIIDNKRILEINDEISKIKLQLSSNYGEYGIFKTNIDLNELIQYYEKIRVLNNEKNELMKIHYPEYCI